MLWKKSSNPGSQIVFIHGFLGSPDDWTGYLEYFNSLGFESHALRLEECELGQIPKEISPQAHLVGYSMGGRFALYLSSLKPEYFSSLTLLSTNPGLLSEKERESRILWEAEWLSKMETMSPYEFVKDWYSQPAFCFFQPPLRRFNQNMQLVALTFRKFSIANLPSLWDHLLQIPSRVQMIFGGLDTKYMKLKRKIKEIDTEQRILLKTVPNKSHAIHLEAPYRIQREIINFIRM